MYKNKNSHLQSKQTNKQTNNNKIETFVFRNIEESTTTYETQQQQQQTYKQTVTQKHKQTESKQRKNDDSYKQKVVNIKHEKKPQHQQQHPLQNLQTAPQKSGMYFVYFNLLLLFMLFVRSKSCYSRNRRIWLEVSLKT